MNGRRLGHLGHLAAVAATAWIGLLHPSQAETVTLRFGQIPSTVRGTSSVYLHLAEQKGFFARDRSRSNAFPFPAAPARWLWPWSRARST